MPEALSDNNIKWSAEVKRKGLTNKSLLDLESLESASKITRPQFLMPRVLYKKVSAGKTLYSLFESGNIVPPAVWTEITSHLNGSKNFKEYLESVSRNGKSTGPFSAARSYQKRCCVLKSRDSHIVLGKINAASAASTSGSANDDEDDLVVITSYAAVDTPIPSKLTNPEYRVVEDEQIVNFALSLLLDSLVEDYPSASGYWSPYRAPFSVTDGGLVEFYQARVDGIYRWNGKAAVKFIIEVKSNSRAWGGVAVDMQESAQMAAWIAATSHVQPNLRPKDNESMQLGTQRRALISQIRREIWVTIASYDNDYVAYISGRDPIGSKSPFMTMKRYGPFPIEDGDHVRALCHMLLALSVQGEVLDKVEKNALVIDDQKASK